jgi:hypothetical protein
MRLNLVKVARLIPPALYMFFYVFGCIVRCRKVGRMEKKVFDFGYQFYPREDGGDIGYTRLDVVLRREPTEEHFDPEEFQLAVLSKHDGIDHLRIHHPWTGELNYRACVGHAHFRDRKQKIVNIYTFGGSLSFDSSKRQTACILTSPAPILRLENITSIEFLLAQETDILMAEKAIASGTSWMALHEKAAGMGPLLFYRACLVSLEKKYRDFVHKELEHIQEFYNFIKREMENLEKLEGGATHLPDLDELFLDKGE